MNFTGDKPHIDPTDHCGINLTFDYLATPYSHEKATVRELRYIAAKHHVAKLMLARQWVFSPIVHCHELARDYNLPKDFGYWEAYDTTMLYSAARIRILKLPGWDKSKGVQAELAAAMAGNKPVVYDELDEELRELAASLYAAS